MAVRLRRLTTAKGLTPGELEVIDHNYWIIENALNSVNAQTPIAQPGAGIVDEAQAVESTPVEAFPIGSVFIAVVSTDPATLLGYGIWSAFGAGRVLIGLNSGDTDFDTVEETGGAKTVASAGTVGAIAASEDAVSLEVGATAASTDSHTHPAPTYTGSATSVVQPYIVVYMWKRTA